MMQFLVRLKERLIAAQNSGIYFYALVLALVVPALPVQADAIGRLFTTSSERSNLEYLRKTKKNLPPKTTEAPADVVVAQPVELPQQVNLQGYVKRNDGKKGTVWVNDKSLQENSSNQDVQVGAVPENSSRVAIKLSANGKRVALKAGQVYDPETNRVREARNHAAQGDSGRIDDEILP